MDLRGIWERLERSGDTVGIAGEVDPRIEMAQVMHALEGKAMRFERVKGSAYPAMAGLCSDRRFFAEALGIPRERLLYALVDALANPVEPPLVAQGPCQEVVEEQVDLTRLPILTHLAEDGGPYVTAGIAYVKDPEYGRNMAIHRLMLLDRDSFGVRIVESRGTHTAFGKTDGDLEMAVCIGNGVHVLLAAAMSPPKGVDELALAHALAPTPLVKCKTVDLEVPADAEFVLEGHLTHRMVDEGPFLDLTEKPDVIRQQPVFKVSCITRRANPVYQALLAGGLEHKLLMGVPREPTIYAEVNKVCDCRNVLITPGGASWLHAVVQIRKASPDDGRVAIDAAFRGHSSLKHVVIVDEDIDLYDQDQIEWALATRFQAGVDLVVMPDQPSSSLDPSALHIPGQKARTSKMGLDATIPWVSLDGRRRTPAEIAGFHRVSYSSVDLSDYLGDDDA
jgi:2,5-furandicarboxylate decarboxylase 1